MLMDHDDWDEDEILDCPDDDGEEIIQCWCGARGTCDELFDEAGLDDSCGGTGCLQCLCGGDLCVCHHHGEMECPGCEDCDFANKDDLDDEGEWCCGCGLFVGGDHDCPSCGGEPPWGCTDDGCERHHGGDEDPYDFDDGDYDWGEDF
jgi:hypothetical protein